MQIGIDLGATKIEYVVLKQNGDETNRSRIDCPKDYSKIIFEIKKFVRENKNSYYFESLGKNLYFNLLRYVDGVIGNSSSGIIEVPSFNIPTINIGNRQKGRLQSKTIFNSDNKSENIYKLINKIVNKKIN